MKKRIASAACLILTGLAAWGAWTQATGDLVLSILDDATRQETPARVEVLDEEGAGFVAEDAIPVGGDGQDRESPWKGTPKEAEALLLRKIQNRYTKTPQFYSTGTSRLTLKPGKYRITVAKGIEYRVHSQEVTVKSEATTKTTVSLSRWIDLPKKGWYGSDGHLHIQRPCQELNGPISKWMQAEDIHVANLLQWGSSKHFHNALQYEHGPSGLYREGDYILASGQENPRTHVLGHTIILGASSGINFPDKYTLYNLFWEEARRQGAVCGYAHGGLAANGQNGLAIDLPHGLLSFVEILQFGSALYDVWYSILNTGFRISPFAGTDYPFGATLPGRERFYTKVEGPFSYDKWLEGLRSGRTFVTNGPILEFSVDGKIVGDELRLSSPGEVAVDASVRFDPLRDDVQTLELIENGQVVQSASRREGSTEISILRRYDVREAAWLAIRASGVKKGEAATTASLAHSAPIYVTIAGKPGLSESPRAKALALMWAGRLGELESRLWTQIRTLGLSTWSDEISGDDLVANRPALLEAIRAAKHHYQDQTR
jgi:hypothetical protein